MPPPTRSQTMGELHEEVVERIVGTSNPIPEGDLMDLMSQMMTKLDNMEGRMKEESIRVQATHKTLFEEINVLKEHRSSKSTTPRNGPIPNLVSEENVGEEEYGGWHGGVEEFGGMGGDFGGYKGGNMGHERFGMRNDGRGNFGGGNGMHGRFDVCNDQFRGGRNFEEESRPRFDDPSKTLKHNLPEFHGKFDPEAYTDW